MAGQWWAGRHLYCPCLEVHIDPWWNFRTLRSLLELFCPSSQRDTESIAFFSLALITLSLLVGLLRTGGQTWIGAHMGCSLQDNNTLEQSVIDISPWKPLRSWGKHTNMWHCLFCQYCTSEKPVTLGTSQEGERRFIYWGHESQEDTMERLIKWKEKERDVLTLRFALLLWTNCKPKTSSGLPEDHIQCFPQ